MTVLDPKGSPTEEDDTPVDTLGALAYIKAFMVDREPFPTTDKVKPWRDGYEGHVAKCMGKELFLPKDMNHWEKWGDDALLLNMKREAIIVSLLSFYFLSFTLRLNFVSNFYFVRLPMCRNGGE